MASRLMHLAVGRELEALPGVRNFDRFRIGLLLPDALPDGKPEFHAASHFRIFLPDGRKTMDFGGFRRRFAQELAQDDLYLGYCLHLLQDCVYRAWLHRACPGSLSVPQLHLDYRLLNGTLCRHYGFRQTPRLPSGLEQEPLLRVAPFTVNAFLDDMQSDFAPPPPGCARYLHEEAAFSFIREAADACREEISALRAGTPDIPPERYAWIS